MNATDTAAALARHAEAVCRRFLPHGTRRGRYWIAGDVHGATGRSLFVRLAPPGTPGRWQDANTGEHGDLLDLIRIGTGSRSLRDALAEARRFLAQPLPPARPHHDTYDRLASAHNLWDRCRPISGTHGEAYLRARRIHRCRFPALRFHPALPYRHASGRWSRFPAMVAAVTGEDHRFTGVQRTWLDAVHPRKAPVRNPRKSLGRIHGRAVRFGEPAAASTLLVGEGIETVLSVVTVLPHAVVPHAVAAAALSAGSLGAFVPPKCIARLVIAQDRDESGERASHRLRLRCTRLGIASTVVFPAGNDFSEDLMAHGPRYLARRLAPLRIDRGTSNRGGCAAG